MAGKIYKVARPTAAEIEAAVRAAKEVKKRHNKFSIFDGGGIDSEKRESHYKKIEQEVSPLKKPKQ